jgi:hypothetical protein
MLALSLIERRDYSLGVIFDSSRSVQDVTCNWGFSAIRER